MKQKRNQLLVTVLSMLVGALILAISLIHYLNLAPTLISSVSWNL